MQWLNDQVQLYRRSVPEMVLKNDLDRARTATGALKAYEEMILSLTLETGVAVVEDEPEFVDPATRMSTRRKPR